MPFDAEASVRAAHLFCAIPETNLGEAIAVAADPCPSLARKDPAALVAFLFVSPRPCAALDALLEG
jgi:hypothetical protein